MAVAAAHAVEHVGLPEAQLNLAQAVVHLATAPKSNRSALGIWARPRRRAPRPVRGGPRPPPRRPLPGRPKLGHGRATTILTTTQGWVPSATSRELGDRAYYDPSSHGFEQEIRSAWNATGDRG